MADCYTPDRDDSPGAKFLIDVYESYRDRAEIADDPEDAKNQGIDAAIDVYTYPMWQAFVDLGAWEFDESEDSPGFTLEDRARMCLANVGAALWYALEEEDES
jgi:hypothetical protein